MSEHFIHPGDGEAIWVTNFKQGSEICISIGNPDYGDAGKDGFPKDQVPEPIDDQKNRCLFLSEEEGWALLIELGTQLMEIAVRRRGKPDE